jgi:hypothetical protein
MYPCSPMKLLSLISLLASIFHLSASAAPRFEFKEGESVVLLGDSFIEREQYVGWIEIAATTEIPAKD